MTPQGARAMLLALVMFSFVVTGGIRVYIILEVRKNRRRPIPPPAARPGCMGK